MSKITPLDIKQQPFRKTVRGYSAADVRSFLDFVAQSFEDVIRENNALKDELHRQAALLEEYKEKESTLRETLMTAQKISQDIRAASKKEADLALQEAEMKAERIVSDAHQKMIRIMERIQELKLERERFAASLKSLIDHHAKLLEAMTQGDKTQDTLDQNLAFLKKQNP